MKFGDNLKKLRKIKKISQEDLASKVGVSRQSVSKWETGEAYPEMTNILALCNIFHCKINDLVNDSITDIDSLDEEVKMNVVKFEKDKQNKMKALSKAIYVLARICKAFVMIGAGCLVALMISLPFFVKEIKVTDNVIEVFGQQASYERVEDGIEFKPINNDNVHEYKLTDKNQVIGVEEFLSVLKSNSNAKIIGFVEVAILFITGSTVLVFFMLKNLEELFENIHNGETPFSMENVKHIKMLAILMIVNMILPNISATIVELVTGHDINHGFDLINIIYILVLFSMAYIFEYGYRIQLDSKGKMYGDVE